MNHKNPSKKKKSWTFPKLSSTIIIIGLIPIIYGIFLYCLQNTSIIPNTSNVIKSQKVPKATELERPLLLSPKQEQIVHHTGYIVSYNESLRLPNWVAYELTRQETQGNAKRSNRFIPDPMIKGTIATNSDYLHFGYDRGHMAPAADMKWSSIAMKESFYFSNICPQHPELNRKKWKDLEDKIRDWAIEDSAIIIICGPIVDKTPKVIGKNKVVIPQQFFKAILSPFTQPPKAIGFLFTNEQSVSPLSNYAVSVDSIEILTGMDFFSPLPDHIEDSIEAHLNINQWNL